MLRGRFFGWFSIVAASGCGAILSSDFEEEPRPPVALPDGAPAEGAAGDAGVTSNADGTTDGADPCVTPPSFCEGFDDPVLAAEWTRDEQSGGTVSLIADGEIGGAVRGSAQAVGDAASVIAFANVARQINGRVSGIDCTFRARADAISWADTFDIFVVESATTPNWASYFASVWDWNNQIGISQNATLTDGGNTQNYPWGPGGIVPDVWLDVHVSLSSTDGWKLHGTIGAASMEYQLPSPGDALVDPVVRFGLHYGEFFDASTAIHVDVDRLVCRVTTL